MPVERFRDPLSGRWVTRETARSGGDFLRELFSGRTRESQDLFREGRSVSPFGETPEPNWTETETQWGLTWDGEGVTLDWDALEESSMPPGMVSFRLRWYVADNPDYPRQYATSDTMYRTEWPPIPEMGAGLGATGIAMIHFRSY